MKKGLIVITIIGLLVINCVSTRPAEGINLNYTGNDIELVGKSTETEIFRIFVMGDRSIAAAMKQGGIKKIHHVDVKTSNFIIFKKITTIVYGEGESVNKGKHTKKSNEIEQNNVPRSEATAERKIDTYQKTESEDKTVSCQYKGNNDFSEAIYELKNIVAGCGSLNDISVENKVKIVKKNTYTIKGIILWNADCYFVICTTENESIKIQKSDIKYIAVYK